MDQIKVKIRQVGNTPTDVVEIFINGRNLIDIIKEIEFPFAKKEGHPDIAGSYEGLLKDIILYPSKHLLGEPKESMNYDGKATILDCECGCYGCWSLVVKIDIEDDRVIWSEFEQIHRGKGSAAGEWDYSALRPFVFDRSEYEKELKKECKCGTNHGMNGAFDNEK